MAKIKRSFVDGPYGQIHVRSAQPDTPSQPPLLCMHMFPQSGRNFARFLEAASSDRMVIALDFPGYGESAPPEQRIEAYEYATTIWHVADALSLIDNHGQVDFFGIHAGAKLAVEAACQRPADVRKIILSSAAVLELNELDDLRRALSHVPLDDKGTRFSKLWNMLIRSRDQDSSLEMCAISLAEMLRGGERYSWGHKAVFDYNDKFAQRLSSLTHPILLLNPNDGLHDKTPRSLAQSQNAELTNLPDWGLNYIETHSAEAASIVRTFLDRRLSTPGAIHNHEAKKTIN